MRYLAASLAAFSILPGTAFGASDLNGTYHGTGYATCIESVDGFAANYAAIIATGQKLTSTNLALDTTFVFNQTKGTATASQNNSGVENSLIPGSGPPTIGYDALTEKLTAKYKFTTAVNGNSVKSVSLTLVGSKSLTTTAGPLKGLAFTLSGATPFKGQVLQSGAILFVSETPTVETATYNGGSFSVICNETLTVYPSP